ncbi:MAG: YraN family protein [Sandaracinaceae bacterium]
MFRTRKEENRARAELGRAAETAVAERLIREGYTIVARNLRVGRAEIDLVAKRGRLVAFVEVRARRTPGFGSPLETIDDAKIARIRAAAARYLHASRYRACAVRFDAVAVTFEPELEIDYLANAF